MGRVICSGRRAHAGLSSQKRHSGSTASSPTSVITPRRTRLVRVPDLHAFRRALVELSLARDSHDARSRIVLVPTRSAARQLCRTLSERSAVPELTTRDELYDLLYGR